MNFTPWPNMISISQGYLVIHIIPTMFIIIMYCNIQNNPVMGCIFLTAFGSKEVFPLLIIFKEPMISTQNFSMIFCSLT